MSNIYVVCLQGVTALAGAAGRSVPLESYPYLEKYFVKKSSLCVHKTCTKALCKTKYFLRLRFAHFSFDSFLKIGHNGFTMMMNDK